MQPDDIFEAVPCCMAGMKEGCRRHNGRLLPHTWFVPGFELSERTPLETEPTTEDTNSAPPGTELVPVYNGAKWSLTTRDDAQVITIIADDVRMFFAKGNEKDDGSGN